MELVSYLIDFILHVDRHLQVFVQTWGAWVYALLFLIVFVETGLVVMPFVRTFAPFVAGVAAMSRPKFLIFNVMGALIWVVSLTVAGYLFGNLLWVQLHLSKIIWALILVPGLIAIVGAWRARLKPR